jgi:predicted negative regulator of RcsB-dependent stress response
MNNGAKFIIIALLIIAAALGFKAYKSGAFDNVKPIEQTPSNGVE